jgi:23S rRNA (uracil1939-C5)-methyltransferase
MDFTFATRRFVEPHEPKGAADVGFALGLHARGLYQKVIDVGTCEIAFPGASAVVATVRRLARERGLAPWDVREHTGLLRILVLRRAEAGAARGAVLANLVTSAEEPDAIRPLAAAVCAAHPEIATFVQTISTRAAQVTQGERELVLHGAGFVEEELGGLAFRVSAASFFQTNTRAADALARLVAARASGGADAAVPGSPAHDLRPAPAGSRSAPPAVGDLRCESASPAAEPPVVYDLCCGAGALGLVVAARAPVREMIGFELVSEAVADARWNAARNGIANARFVAGDLALTLPEADLPPPDVCIADPPRAGLHPKVVAELVRLAPPRVVYVSCNPAAAVRDLVPLVGAGYRATAIEPLDLFPHTPHLECVFTLERA